MPWLRLGLELVFMFVWLHLGVGLAFEFGLPSCGHNYHHNSF